LALKGILGLGAYAILLNSTGETQRATIYMNQAQDFGRKEKAFVYFYYFFLSIKSKLLVKRSTR
jgi:hypothetical protein